MFSPVDVRLDTELGMSLALKDTEYAATDDAGFVHAGCRNPDQSCNLWTES